MNAMYQDQSIANCMRIWILLSFMIASNILLLIRFMKRKKIWRNIELVVEKLCMALKRLIVHIFRAKCWAFLWDCWTLLTNVVYFSEENIKCIRLISVFSSFFYDIRLFVHFKWPIRSSFIKIRWNCGFDSRTFKPDKWNPSII